MCKGSPKIDSLGLIWRLQKDLGSFQHSLLTSLEGGPHLCPEWLLELQCPHPSSTP